jgi:hypothetical protein
VGDDFRVGGGFAQGGKQHSAGAHGTSWFGGGVKAAIVRQALPARPWAGAVVSAERAARGTLPAQPALAGPAARNPS